MRTLSRFLVLFVAFAALLPIARAQTNSSAASDQWNALATQIEKASATLQDNAATADAKNKATAALADARKNLDALRATQQAPLLSTGGIVAIVGIALLCFVGMVGWMIKNPAKPADDGLARAMLAKAVTTGAMSFIVLVSLGTLVAAGVSAALSPGDKDKNTLFFEMAKWILATVLPVVGAWVGGVLAFYFGKENFKAGTEHAEKVLELTGAQKLDGKKASEVGIEIGQANVKQLSATETLDGINLVALQKAYGPHERMPILDPKGAPLACLHLSILNKYLETLTDAEKGDATKTTLGNLSKIIPVKWPVAWKPDDSFATAPATDTLSSVKSRMNEKPECKDVFVTEDGTRKTPVKRWITNIDILKIAGA